MRYWPAISINGDWSLLAHVSRISAGGPLLGLTTDTTPVMSISLEHAGADTLLSITTASGTSVEYFLDTVPESATLSITVNGGTQYTAQLGEVVATGTLSDPVVVSDGIVCLGYDTFTSLEGSFDLFDVRLYSKTLTTDAVTDWRNDVEQGKFLSMPMR